MEEKLYTNIVIDEKIEETVNAPPNCPDDIINLNLTSNCAIVDIGQIFTYTLIIENNSEIDFYNINITQQLHRYLRLCEVTVDSMNLQSINKYNEYLSMFIDELRSGEKKLLEIIVEVMDTSNIEYFKTVATLETVHPNNNTLISIKSNNCIIKIISPQITLTKKSSIIEAVIGQRVTFTLLSKNTGNIPVNNLIIRDILKPELKFIHDSIKLDGSPIIEENILSGINIGNLDVGEIKSLTFDMEVIDLPDTCTVSSLSLANYQFKIPGDNSLREGNSKSNANILRVQSASIDIYKTLNREDVSLGEQLTLTIKIENIGTVEVKNIKLTEIIPDSFEIIDGTFKIDNQVINNISLSRGILIGDLKIGQSRNLICTLIYSQASNSRSLPLTTKANFDYKLSSGLIFKGRETIKTLEIKTNISNFKYVELSEVIYKRLENPFIDEVENVNINVDISEFHVLKTSIGKSHGGQILTGFKVIIQGFVNEIIEYTSDSEINSLFTVTSKVPFSSFIVLPSNFKEGSKIDIDYIIEDISYKKRDEDSVYTTVNLLLVANIHSYINH